MAYGFNAFVGWGKESAWGTKVVADTFLEALSASIPPTFDRFDVKNLVGSMAEPEDCQGVKRVEGTVSTSVFHDTIGDLLATFFDESVAAGPPIVKTYTTPTQANEFAPECPLPPLTLVVCPGTADQMSYIGAIATAISFTIAPNQALQAEIGFLAKDAEIEAAVTPTYNSTVCPYTFDKATLQIAGVTTELIEEFTIAGEAALEGIVILNGTQLIGKIGRTGFQTITVSGTASFNDLSEYQKFLDQTEQSFRLTVLDSAGNTIDFNMPRVVYTAYPVEVTGRERLTVSFEGKARQVGGNSITVMLTDFE